MFLRSLPNNSQPTSLNNTQNQDRALELSQTFSVDWNGDLNQLYPDQESSFSSQAQSFQNDINAQPQPQQSYTGENRIAQNLYNRRSLDLFSQSEIEEPQELRLVRRNASIQERGSSNYGNYHNYIVLSRSDHLNEEDFFEAIEFLFHQLRTPRIKPKFRYCLNRTKTKCPICYQKIKRSEAICRIQCKHRFHKSCLEEWAQRNPSCPLCRKDFIS